MGELKVFGLSVERGRWLYVALGALINMCLGAVYAFSVFRRPLEEMWGIGATHSGLPFMVFLGVFSVGMVVAGRGLDRWGPKKTGLVGGVLVGAGWLLAGLSPSIGVLTLLYGVLAGAGVGVLYGCPIAVSAKWFPDKKGLAVGLTVMGFGLSALVMAPLLELSIRALGPLATFSVFGGGFLALLVLLSLPMRVPPAGWSAPGREAGAGREMGAPVDLETAAMLRSSAFYGLWGSFTVGCLAGLMAIGIAAPYGQEVARLAPGTAAVAVSVFALFNAAGRPLFGWLTDLLTPKKTAVLSFSSIIVASTVLAMWGEGNPTVYFVGFSLLWLNLGGWLAIAPTATATFFGTKYYGSNYGLVYTGYGLGAILGMVLSGLLRDLTGSYVLVFPPVIGMAVGGLLLALFLLNPVTGEPRAIVPRRSSRGASGARRKGKR